MEGDGCTDCCCLRLLALPFLTLVYGQRRVNSKIRHAVHRIRPNLSQRAKDLAVRRQELALDHLELDGRCCVCQQQGAPVAGRGRPDGGMTLIDFDDIDELSATFGVPVRGYLCTTCLDVAVNTHLQHHVGGSSPLRNTTDESGSGYSDVVDPRPSTAALARRAGGVELAVPTPVADVSLPAPLLDCVLQDHRCGLCRVTPPRFFDVSYAQLLCRRCVVARRRRRHVVALGRPMPPQVLCELRAVLRQTAAAAVEQRQPDDAGGASEAVRPSFGTSDGTSQVGSARAAAMEFSVLPARPPQQYRQPTSLFDTQTGADLFATRPSSLSSTGIDREQDSTRALPNSTLFDPPIHQWARFSEAHFDERGADSVEDDRTILRRTAHELFAGRQFVAASSATAPDIAGPMGRVNLFEQYWGPGSSSPPAAAAPTSVPG